MHPLRPPFLNQKTLFFLLRSQPENIENPLLSLRLSVSFADTTSVPCLQAKQLANSRLHVVALKSHLTPRTRKHVVEKAPNHPGFFVRNTASQTLISVILARSCLEVVLLPHQSCAPAAGQRPPSSAPSLGIGLIISMHLAGRTTLRWSL